MKLFLFGLALFSMGTASASTIYLLNGQNFPYGDHTVSCGQPSFAKPCVIDLEKKEVKINGKWAGGTSANFPIEDLVEIAQFHEKAGSCYGITLK